MLTLYIHLFFLFTIFMPYPQALTVFLLFIFFGTLSRRCFHSFHKRRISITSLEKNVHNSSPKANLTLFPPSDHIPYNINLVLLRNVALEYVYFKLFDLLLGYEVAVSICQNVEIMLCLGNNWISYSNPTTCKISKFLWMVWKNV